MFRKELAQHNGMFKIEVTGGTHGTAGRNDDIIRLRYTTDHTGPLGMEVA